MNLFDVYPINNINIVKAKGSYVWDDKGEQYLDLYGGHAVISIGHTHPHWVQRIEEQLKKIEVVEEVEGKNREVVEEQEGKNREVVVH